MKIKKGDTVVVISGKDKKAKGIVLKVNIDANTVLVDGVNIKTGVATVANQKKLVQKPYPIQASNVAILDPKTAKPSRIGYQMDKGKKVRIAKKSGTKLDK